jgi:hypothetical protein
MTFKDTNCIILLRLFIRANGRSYMILKKIFFTTTTNNAGIQKEGSNQHRYS